MSFWAGKTALVTGGSGSLGSALIPELVRRGVRSVRCYSRGEFAQIQLIEKLGPDVASYVRPMIGDVRDSKRLALAMRDVDIVIHAAALKQVPVCDYNPSEAIETNILGSRNVAMAAIDASVERAMLISTDKACVHSAAPVSLADGSTAEIWRIVKDRLSVQVRTLTRQGPSVSTATGWYKTKRNGRRMVFVSYAGLTVGTNRRRGVWLTEDHPVLTDCGWVVAGRLSDRSRLITAEIAPTRRQSGLLCGTLLGDASFFKNSFHVSHCEKQQEWTTLKHRALCQFALPVRRCRPKNPNAQTQFGFSLRSNSAISELCAAFYRHGKKSVPRDLVERFFSPELLAAWYLDDGCISYKNARLATHGFRQECVDWLADFMTLRGFEAYCYQLTVAGKTYYELRLTVRGSGKLFETIGRFVPPGLRYKLPDWAPPFDEESWDLGEPTQQHIANAIVEHDVEYEALSRLDQSLPPDNRDKKVCLRGHLLEGDNVYLIKKTGSRQCKTCAKATLKRRRDLGVRPNLRRDVYCLEVEDTHNFIVNNIVLHNCSPTTFYGVTKAAAEKIFCHSNVYVGAGRRTTLGAVRYGNVMGSRGSVIHVWRSQIARGEPIAITDPEATRFWISMPQAVEFVLSSVEMLEAGNVFIPKLETSTVGDLADLVAGNRKRLVTGLRPSEKMHEVLFGEDETASQSVTPLVDRYILGRGSFTPRAGRYSSDDPSLRMRPDRLAKMVAAL